MVKDRVAPPPRLERDDGGPAHPASRFEKHNEEWIEVRYAGISLRDYFAGMALQGIQASMSDTHRVMALLDQAKKRGEDLSDCIALLAYETADAMIEQRKK